MAKNNNPYFSNPKAAPFAAPGQKQLQKEEEQRKSTAGNGGATLPAKDVPGSAFAPRKSTAAQEEYGPHPLIKPEPFDFRKANASEAQKEKRRRDFASGNLSGADRIIAAAEFSVEEQKKKTPGTREFIKATVKKYGIDPKTFDAQEHFTLLNRVAKEDGVGASWLYSTDGSYNYSGFSKERANEMEFLEILAANNSRKKNSTTDFGAVVTGGIGAIDALSFGFLDDIGDHYMRKEYERAGLPIGDYTPANVETVMRKSIEEHPVAYTVGETAGIAAQMALTAGLSAPANVGGGIQGARTAFNAAQAANLFGRAAVNYVPKVYAGARTVTNLVTLSGARKAASAFDSSKSDTEFNEMRAKSTKKAAADNNFAGIALYGMNTVQNMLDSPAQVADVASAYINAVAAGDDSAFDELSSNWNAMARTQAARSGIMEDKTGIGAFAWEVGLGIGDNIIRNVIGGQGASMALLATTAFPAAVQQSYEQSGDIYAAVANGFVQTAFEYITEQVPTDRFWEAVNNPKMRKALLKNVLLGMGFEGGGEALNALVGNAAEVGILGENSGFMITLSGLQQMYMEQGASEATARDRALREAFMDFFVKQPLLALGQGALSGGIMQGLANGIGALKKGAGKVANNRVNKRAAAAEAQEYMLTPVQKEFDDLSPEAQAIVRKEFADRPQELQAFIQRKSPTGSISSDAQKIIDDATDVIYGKKKKPIDTRFDHAQGIFDEKVGTPENIATQKEIDEFVDYSYKFGIYAKTEKPIPKQKDRISIAPVAPAEAEYIKNASGIDISNMTHVLRDNDIRHVKKSHGEDTNEKFPVTAEDQKKIPEIIRNYDDILFVDGGDKKGIVYVKRHNGVTYYLEAMREDENALVNKQMIKVSTGTIPDIKGIKEAINKKWGSDSSPNDSEKAIPRVYVRDVWNESSSVNSLSREEQIVNTDSSPKSDKEESIFDADVPMRHIDGSVRTYAEYRAEQDAAAQAIEAESAHQSEQQDFTPAPDIDVDSLEVSDEVKSAIKDPNIKVDTSEDFIKNAQMIDEKKPGRVRKVIDAVLSKILKVQYVDEPLSLVTRDIRKRAEIAAHGDANLFKFLHDNFLQYINKGQDKRVQIEREEVLSIYRFINEVGIKPDSRESAAAQMLGEGYWQDKYGERHAYTLNDVKREFPDSWEKIVQVKDFVRSVYDKLEVEGNGQLKRIHPDAYSYYESEMEKKRIRIDELRDKPKLVQAHITLLEGELESMREKLSDLESRKNSGADVHQALEEIEQKRNSALQSFEARKRKDTKAAATDESRAARYADKADAVRQENISALDKEISKLKKKISDIEYSLRRQKQKISEAAISADEKEIAKLELEIRDIEYGLDSGELVRDKRILHKNNFFHHRKKVKRGAAARFISVMESKVSIDPSLVGTSRETKPKRRFAGFMQHQGLEEYTPDALGGLLEYIPEYAKKIAYDEVLVRGREFQKSLAFATKESKNANGFLESLHEYLNTLAGKTNFNDRPAQIIFGRKALKLLEAASGLRKSALFPFSFTIAMKQFSNIANLPYYVKNVASVGKGLWDMKDLFDKQSEKSKIIAQSGFLNERYLEQFYRNLDKKITFDKVSSFMLEAGDQLATNIIWFSAYEDALQKKAALEKKGEDVGRYSDPIHYADDVARKCVGGRGDGELPPILQSKAIKALLPFSVESLNSQNNFYDAIRKGDLVGAVFSQLITYGLNAALGAIGLQAVGFDFVDAIVDIYSLWCGDDEDEDEEKDVPEKIKETAQRLGAEVIESQWYSSLLGLFAGQDWFQNVLGDHYDDQAVSNQLLAISPIADAIEKGDIREVFYGYIPAGAQIKRTKTFLQDIGVAPEIILDFGELWGGGAFDYRPPQNFPASYTDDGRLRFPIEPGIWNYFKGTLFGEYATNEGKEYIDTGRAPYSEERTEAFNAIVATGADPNVVYDTINEASKLPKAEQKRRFIMDVPGLTAEQKGMLDNVFFEPRENPVDYSSEDNFVITSKFSDASTQRKAFGLLNSGMSAKDAVNKVEHINSIEGDKDETGNTIKDSETLKKLRYVHNLDIPDEQKGALYRYCMVESDNKRAVLARANGLSDAALGRAYAYLSLVEGTKGANGKTISGSKNRNIEYVMSQLDLTPEEKDGLRVMFMTDSKARDYYENRLLNNLLSGNRLTPEEKKQFTAWHDKDDKRVDEDELFKALYR